MAAISLILTARAARSSSHKWCPFPGFRITRAWSCLASLEWARPQRWSRSGKRSNDESPTMAGSRAVQKLIAGIVEGLREDAPFRLARSHRETRPTLGLLARISVRHRTVMASTVRHAARWPVRPLVVGNNAMPNFEDRSMASRAVWHSPLRPDHADCHRACARLTTAGLQVLDGWHSSRRDRTAAGRVRESVTQTV